MADDANPTPGASEGDQPAAGAADAGTSGDGGASGSDSTATSAALAVAERERYEKTQRELQAAKDSERSKREAAERELAQLKGQATDSPTQPQAFDARTAYAELQKLTRLDATADSLRETYKHADAALFERATEFDSPEALTAALKASHEAKATVIAAEVEAQVAAKLAEAAKQYGFTITTPASPEKDKPVGELTIERLHAMTMDEQDDYEAANPGAIDRVIRSAFDTAR